MAGESCWQCGTVLSASGGRCPMCGAEQPTARGPASVSAPLRPPSSFARGPRPESPVQSPNAKKALPWIVLAVGLLAIGVVAMVWTPRKPEAVAAPSRAPVKSTADVRPVDPNDLHIQDPRGVDPLEVLGRARARALAWQKDAALVSIRAEQVAHGHVDLTAGGTVEYVFGKPTGPGFGPSVRIAGKRLRIALGAQGTTVEEAPPKDGAAAPDPTCPLEDAEHKAEAAGVRASATVSASYEVSDKYKKAVWRIATPDGAQVRTVDGWSCVILVR